MQASCFFYYGGAKSDGTPFDCSNRWPTGGLTTSPTDRLAPAQTLTPTHAPTVKPTASPSKSPTKGLAIKIDDGECVIDRDYTVLAVHPEGMNCAQLCSRVVCEAFAAASLDDGEQCYLYFEPAIGTKPHSGLTCYTIDGTKSSQIASSRRPLDQPDR